MPRCVRFLMLALVLVLSGCSVFAAPTSPGVASPTFPPRQSARVTPSPVPQTFGPFFDSSAPPDDACRRQMESWGDESGEWVIGPSYCTYWPSDEDNPEAFSLCVGEWQDVSLEANLRYYTFPSRVGIVLRALNPNDALVFVIEQDGEQSCYWQVRHGADGDSTDDPEMWGDPIDPHPLALPQGSGREVVVARVTIKADADRLVAYVNGMETSVFENAPVRAGRVGLYMRNSGVEQAWADVLIRAN